MKLDLSTATALAPIDVTRVRTIRLQCRPGLGDPSSAAVTVYGAFGGPLNTPRYALSPAVTLDLSGESVTEIDVTNVGWLHLVCTAAVSGVTVDVDWITNGPMQGRTLPTRVDLDATGIRGAPVGAQAEYRAFVLAAPASANSTGALEIKHSVAEDYNAVSFSPAATLTLDGSTVTQIDAGRAGVLQAACTTAQSGQVVDLYWYLRQEVGTDMVAKNFILEAAAGRVSGYSSERKFGRNIDIDSSSPPEDIWNGGGLYTGYPTSGSAETVDVFSSDANDTSAGTGARTIRMFGLDADYNEQTEDITLNGTTAVTSTKTWWRLNRATVTSAGSGNKNAGEITIRHTTTTANVFAVMPAEKGQTAILAYTVPAGKIGLFSQLKLVVEGGSPNGAEVGFEFIIRDNGGAGVERTILYGIAVRGTSFTETSTFTEPIPEKTDVWVRVVSASDNNTIVSGDFQYMLVPA